MTFTPQEKMDMLASQVRSLGFTPIEVRYYPFDGKAAVILASASGGSPLNISYDWGLHSGYYFNDEYIGTLEDGLKTYDLLVATEDAETEPTPAEETHQHDACCGMQTTMTNNQTVGAIITNLSLIHI